MVRQDTDAALAADSTNAVSGADARELGASPSSSQRLVLYSTETMVDHDSAS
jgi:hypothetical protein